LAIDFPYERVNLLKLIKDEQRLFVIRVRENEATRVRER
jgi:hypothetical protein